MEKSIVYYKNLLKKYFNSSCSNTEENELAEFMGRESSNRTLLAELHEVFSNLKDEGVELSPDRELHIQKVLEQRIAKSRTKAVINYTLLKKITTAAAVIVFVAGLAFLLLNDNSKTGERAKKDSVVKDIVPGSNKAFLTLSDGSKIDLSSIAVGQITSASGIVISKTSDSTIEYSFKNASDENASTLTPAFHTIETPVKGQYTIVLQDGTKIWLNAASKLRFPSFFAGNERVVEAEGELYFDVAKGKKAFKVVTGKQIVEVLGTHFSISSNSDVSSIKTTLLEGSIKISDGKNYKILKPGDQPKYNGEFTISPKQNVEAETGWKDGYFVFDSTDFVSAQSQIEKWYDVKFHYNKIPDEPFYGRISRNVPISRVLKIMEIVGGIQFDVKGRDIYIK